MRRRGGGAGGASSSNSVYDSDDRGIEVHALLPTKELSTNNEQRHGMNRLLFNAFWFFKTLEDGCWTKFVLWFASFGLSMSAFVIYIFFIRCRCVSSQVIFRSVWQLE